MRANPAVSFPNAYPWDCIYPLGDPLSIQGWLKNCFTQDKNIKVNNKTAKKPQIIIIAFVIAVFIP